jgi:hypothetical protein
MAKHGQILISSVESPFTLHLTSPGHRVSADTKKLQGVRYPEKPIYTPRAIKAIAGGKI